MSMLRFAVPILAMFAMVSCLPAVAQVNTDSLWNVWSDTTKPSKDRLTAIGDVIWYRHMPRQPDSAAFFARQQFELARRVDDKEQMASALNTEAMSFLRSGNIQQAISCYERSLALCRELGKQEDIAGAISTLASAHAMNGDYTEALRQYAVALEIYDGIGNGKYRARTLERMGGIAMTQGNYPVAVDYFARALTIQDTEGDSEGAARSYNYLGTINSYMKDYENALRNYNESLRIKELAGQKEGAANTLGNIGMLYFRQKMYGDALANYERSLGMLQEAGQRSGVAAILNNIGMVYQALEDYAEAYSRYETSLAIYEELSDKKGITNALFNMSETLDKLGRKKEAKQAAERALAMARSMGLVAEMKNTGKSLYALYKEEGRTDKALEMFELYVAMRDSLMNEENQKDVMRRQFQYEYDKKETIMAAEQEKKDLLAKEEMRRKDMQRNAFIGGFALMLLLAGVFFAQRNRISQEKARSEKLLLNILPEETAEELKTQGKARSRLVPEASVLFTDFKGFTAISEQLGPRELVEMIDMYFRAFDRIILEHGLEKIKTIGDAYMAAGGLPVRKYSHPADTVRAALRIVEATEAIGKELERQGKPCFQIRVGVHTGPLIAGVVGEHKFQYDIWGDTVNTASRMESSGGVGRVNISDDTHELVKEFFECEYRGEIEAKGKGKIGMWFVNKQV